MLNNMITSVMARLVSVREDEQGQTMVEYGLIVAFIALVALAGVTLLGTNLNTLFSGVDLTP